MNKSFLQHFKAVPLLLITVVVLTACSGGGPQPPGKYAGVAQCLTEKGVILYGAYWCPHCQAQRQDFGSDSQFITYVECDDNGPNGDRKACLDAGVSSFPTWFFPGQGNLIGRNPIFVIAKLANCQDQLPAEDLEQLRQAEEALEASGQSMIDTAASGETSSDPARELLPGETGQPEPVGRTVPSDSVATDSQPADNQ
jgi:glutaredoxin